MATIDSSESPGPTRISKRFSRAGAAEDRLLLELNKKYRILAQLGEGGTARVWLAMARGPSGFNKLVVLKTVRGELFDNAAIVEMFLEEARLAARLNHPHIVQTNEVFEQSQHPVIVMEYLDGLPFSAVMERQREGSALALAMLLRILSDALSGLHAAHELLDYDGTPLRVVHRDVSPQNLFVTFAGQVKVLDFGIAQFNASGETTESGVIKGKLRYMAPEQLRGGEPVDHRADIYSMGVVLWEVATAKRMWGLIPEPTILKRILSGDLPRARDVAPEVDLELEGIIATALSLHPEDRYDSALEFQTALDQYMATLGAPLRNRDLGRALSKMFDDVREERRQTIERQLARSDTLHDLQLADAALPELTSFSNVQMRPRRTRDKFRPGPRVLVSLALLAMTTFATAIFWPLLQDRFAPKPEEIPAALEPKQPAPAPAQKTVSLRITAFPRDAILSLDGTRLGSNPHSSLVLRDVSRLHEVLVEAEGHVPVRRHLDLSTDQELVLTLQSAAPAPLEDKEPQKVVRAPTPTGPRTRPTSEERSEPPSARCSPPYYYDARGIKKYRAECL